MATKQVKVCDIFGTHEAQTVRVIVELWDGKSIEGGEHVFIGDPIDLSERAQKRLISFIERGLRPPSKKAKGAEHGD